MCDISWSSFHTWFQERLLLSLLPAHIAMEMKAEIIQRLQGPKAGQMQNTNNFHNLYVKRHTNVRYAAALFSFLSKAGEPVCQVGDIFNWEPIILQFHVSFGTVYLCV